MTLNQRRGVKARSGANVDADCFGVSRRRQQPPPRVAWVHIPAAGSNTTPTTGLPSTDNAIIIENSPFFRAKPPVPSIGSMIQSRVPANRRLRRELPWILPPEMRRSEMRPATIER